MSEQPHIAGENAPLEPVKVEWWRKPLFYTFKVLPLIVLIVLVWNFITVTRERMAELRKAPTPPTAPAPP